MNISKKCAEAWNEFKKIGGKYLRALLVIVGVATALFAGHEFDAFAGGGSSQVDPDEHLHIAIQVNTELVNMPEVSNPDDYYKPFRVHSEFNEQGHLGHGFDLSGPGESGDPDTRCFSGSAGEKPKQFGDYMEISVVDGYDVIDSNGNHHPSSDGTSFVERTALSNSTTRYDYNVKAIGRKPKVIIKNGEGTDIADTKFDIASDFELISDGSGGYKYKCNSLNIKVKTDSGLDANTVKNLNLDWASTQAEDFTCDNNGNITLKNYQGYRDIVFDCKKYIFFGSPDNYVPWTHEQLAASYTLKLGNTELTRLGDWSWGITYSAESEPTSWSLTMAAKDGYEFNESTYEVKHDGTRIASTLDTNHKKLTFTVTNNKSKGKQYVTIGGEKYTDYKNKFQYSDSGYKLTDLARIQRRYEGASLWSLIRDTTDDGKNYEEGWTVASSGKKTPGLKRDYKLFAENGYTVDTGTTLKVNQSSAQNVNSEGVVSIETSSLTDNTMIVDGIKRHFDVKFLGSAGIESDINVNNAPSNWNKSVTVDQNLDNKQVTMSLDIANDRRIFASDAATTIENANQGKVAECVRSEDGKKMTLTINHSTSQTAINIPDEVLEWKKSNVDFSVGFGDVDEMYRDEALQSIELHKGNDEQGTLIPLKEGSNSTLINVDKQSGVSYGDLQYTLYLKDSTYLDLSEASVALDGVTEDYGECKVTTKAKNKLVFKLDPECAGAPYRENLKFKITGCKSNLKVVQFMLCPKVNLYLKKSDGSLINIVNAPSDSPTSTNVSVPDGGATYVAVYTDYSKKFDVENIVGNNVSISDQELESFNRVSFKVTPGDDGERSVELVDPAETAPPVKFTPVEGIKYYNVNEDGSMSSPISGTINIPYKKTFSFAVQCNEGYDSNTLELKANGNVFGSAEGFTKESRDGYDIFTIDETKAIYPITITGNVHATQKKITFNKELGGNFGTCSYIYNGASVSGDVTVLYGQGIAFEVNLPELCNQSDIVVKFNGEPVTKVNGKYVLNNITSDGEIRVSNVSLNKYPVTFASNSRATYKNKDGSGLSGTVEVEHGKNFEFRVQPNSGYTLGQDSVVYLKYANGQTTTLKPTNDVYKISNITQACTISVENVEDIVYTIKLIPADGVTYRNDVDNVIKDMVKIKHGRNFEFSVLLSDEYDDSLAGMNIIVNDGKSSQSSAQKIASGRYVIPNVSEDITIKVGNVRKNTYTVSLVGAEGIDYYDSSGRIITGDNQVDHHSDFSFKVDLYPAYSGSNITVMLGDTPMSPDSNGFYTISKISESKTVTVVGIEQSLGSELVNNINNLPDNLKDLSDVDDVIAATKVYESLSDAEKALVGNADKLKSLQEQVKEFHHVSNDVRVSGVDWYIKLYAIPITDDTDACGRIYKKLGSEYILSLYNVYLWNTLTDTRYTLPQGQSAIITLPTPDMSYFEKPTAIHEKDGGKIEFINASINSDVTTFQTDSFSPMGIIANRSSTPGRSSLLDSVDANVDAISNAFASMFGNDTNKVTRSGSDRDDYNDLSGNSDDDMSGNIDEKFRSRNNKVTPTSSALRLVLVLMILVLIGLMIYFFIKNRKDKKNSGKE